MNVFCNSKRLVVIAGLLAIGACAHAQNLVTNGDFESADPNNFEPTSWTQVNGSFAQATDVTQDYTNYYTGGNSAFFRGWMTSNGGPTGISQDISTVAGQTYQYSFEMMDSGGETGGGFAREFWFSVDGAKMVDVANTTSAADWTNYTGSFVASKSSTNLTFMAGDDSVDTYGYWVDTVSVNAAPVPEPTSMAALGIGLAAFIRRRKKA